MGRTVAAVEIPVGFIDDQRQPPVTRKVKEPAHQPAGVFHTAGVVRCDQNDGAGAVGDQLCRGIRAGKHGLANRQRAGFDPFHIEPHLVIEIPRRRQDGLIAVLADRGDGGRKGLIAACSDRHLLG